jgi:FkbM family methyltransferase
MDAVQRLKRERMYMKALGVGYVFSRKAIGQGIFSVRTKYGQLFFRPTDSDLMTFWQTLGAREYDLRHFPQYATVKLAYHEALERGQTPVIIDAGANIGAASVWFSNEFPAAKILAVEPDPANAHLCRLNTEGRNVEVVEAAIGARAGSVSLVPSATSWSIQTVRGGDVPVVTVADLLERTPNGDLLIAKIDIEGFESDLFAEATEWLAQVTALIIEPHDWMLPGRGSSHAFRAAVGPEFDMLLSGENVIFVRAEPRAYRPAAPEPAVEASRSGRGVAAMRAAPT